MKKLIIGVVVICISVSAIFAGFGFIEVGKATSQTSNLDWSTEDYPNYVKVESGELMYDEDDTVERYWVLDKAGNKTVAIPVWEIPIDAKYRDIELGGIPPEKVDDYKAEIMSHYFVKEKPSKALPKEEYAIGDKIESWTSGDILMDPVRVDMWRNNTGKLKEVLDYLRSENLSSILELDSKIGQSLSSGSSLYFKSNLEYENLERWEYWALGKLGGVLPEDARRLTLSDVEEVVLAAYEKFDDTQLEERYHYITEKFLDITYMLEDPFYTDTYYLTEDGLLRVNITKLFVDLNYSGETVLGARLAGTSETISVDNKSDYEELCKEVLRVYPEVGGYKYD